MENAREKYLTMTHEELCKKVSDTLSGWLFIDYKYLPEKEFYYAEQERDRAIKRAYIEIQEYNKAKKAIESGMVEQYLEEPISRTIDNENEFSSFGSTINKMYPAEVALEITDEINEVISDFDHESEKQDLSSETQSLEEENQVIEYEETNQPEIEYQDVVLKSANPEQYPDRVVRCRVIKREDIGSYIDSIPDEDKCVGCKSEPVEARVGQVGERVLTTLKTTYNGKDYILSEVENEVKETEMEDGTKQPDIIVTNTHSTSNEEYIVRANKFPKMYSANTDGTFTPAPEPRQVARLSEDVVIETSWGEMAVGLNGSYIVTYDAERQSYNTIEKGAFESTYTIQDGLNKQL